MTLRLMDFVTLSTESGTWYRFDPPDVPYEVRLQVGKASDGRLVCSAFSAQASDGAAITSRSLRDLPVLAMLCAIGPTLVTVPSAWRPPHPGRKGHDLAHFKEVVRHYRRHLRHNPRAPLKSLAAQYGIADVTANRWLHRAAEMGLLVYPSRHP